MEAAFFYCSVPGGPFPQNLASRAMDRWYGEYLRVSGANTNPLGEGETLYGRKVMTTICSGLNTVTRMARVNHRRIRDILLDDYSMNIDLCPPYVRVLLLPKDPAITAKWGAKARSEILGNPRLLKTLQELKFDLTWL